MKRWVVMGLLALLVIGCGKQRRASEERRQVIEAGPGVSVVVREAAINDLFQAVGTLHRSSHLLVKSEATNFALDIPPPRIEINLDGIMLRTDVTVHMAGEQYTSPAEGTGHVVFDPAEQTLFLEMDRLTVDIRARILGVRVTLEQHDVSRYFDSRVKLLDDLPLASSFRVKQQGGADREIRYDVVKHWIRYQPGEIALDLAVDFTGTDVAPETKP